MIMEGFVLRILYRGIRHIKVHLLILNNWNFFWIVQFRLFQNLIICLLVAQKNLLVLDARCRQKMILILLKNKIVLWKNKSFFSKDFYEYAFLTSKYVFLELPFKKGITFFQLYVKDIYCRKSILLSVFSQYLYLDTERYLNDTERYLNSKFFFSSFCLMWIRQEFFKIFYLNQFIYKIYSIYKYMVWVISPHIRGGDKKKVKFNSNS